MAPGNLAASCLLRLGQMGGSPAELGFVVAVALFDACQQLIGPGRLVLKWPNDLLLDGAKISGILLELEGSQLILGVGVNLAYAPSVPGRPVMCLADVGIEISPADFLDLLASEFDAWRGKWKAQGFDEVRQAWLARAHPRGTPLLVHSGQEQLKGEFYDLATDGALQLDVGGEIRMVHAGDVWNGEAQG